MMSQIFDILTWIKGRNRGFKIRKKGGECGNDEGNLISNINEFTPLRVNVIKNGLFTPIRNVPILQVLRNG